MKRSIAILLTLGFAAFLSMAGAQGQQLWFNPIGQGLGGTPAPTPTPTPTPGPTPNVAAGADLGAAINAQAAGYGFVLACGTYRLALDAGGVPAALFPKSNQSFTVTSFPGVAVPASPPCAIINGAIRLGTTDSPDTSWHAVTIGGHNLWYNTVGSANVINTAGSSNRIIGYSINCVVGSGGYNKESGTGTAYIMWTSGTAETTGTSIVDSNGNTETAQNNGTTGATAPAIWATAINATTNDNGITWKLTALASAGACSYPQDLFYTPTDSDPRTWVMHKHTLVWNGGNIPTGYWYLDWENVGGHGKFSVYVPDNPTSTTVEFTVVQHAFITTTSVSGVTIQGLSIAGFATKNQGYTLQTSGPGLVSSNWITHNHGEAIGDDLGTSGIVWDSNEVVENGESGINTGGGGHHTVTNNKIERNNEDETAYGNEEGGTKFANTSGDTITGNTVSCNNGNGLWADSGATNQTWSLNTSANNLDNGGSYELSHSGTIIKNTFSNNGQFNDCQCVAAHIPIRYGVDDCTGPQTSSGDTRCQTALNGTGNKYEMWLHESDTTTVGGSAVNGNTVTSNCGGIHITGDSRSVPPASDVISYNTETIHTGSNVVSSILGGDNGATNIYSGSPNSLCTGAGAPFSCCTGSLAGTCLPNTWDHNTYHFDNSTSLAAAQWEWGSTANCQGSATTGMAFSFWQANCGLDSNGSAVTP